MNLLQVQRIRAQRRTLIERWMPQLVAKLGRSEAELRANGLLCGDFNARVRLDFEDGSSAQFENTFVLESDAEGRQLAVFTEHCGYHEFELFDDDRVSVVSD